MPRASAKVYDCIVCGRTVQDEYPTRQLCGPHFREWYRDEVLRKQSCKKHNCENKVTARGLCGTHYRHVRNMERLADHEEIARMAIAKGEARIRMEERKRAIAIVTAHQKYGRSNLEQIARDIQGN